MKPEPTISTILIGVHNYLVTKERSTNKYKEHPIKKKKPLEIPNSFGYKVILSAKEQEELLELAHASPENEAESRLFVWFKNWRIKNKHDWQPNSGLPGPTFQNIELLNNFCKLNGIELNNMCNVNYCQRSKDNSRNKSEPTFKWWMILSLLIYIVSLSIIMYNDYIADGHFTMSDGLYMSFSEPEWGVAIIHWIMFLIAAFFLGIVAMAIPPWLGIIIIPGPLYCIYVIGNFMLMCISQIIWGIINIVFLVLFGWMQYVG